MIDTAKLKEKILDLAIRGKLVPQDPNDEPASVLLEKIRAEKLQMVKEGKLKQKDIKDDTLIFVGEDNLHYEKFGDGSIKCIEEEIPFEIPKSWAWCRLRDIFNIGSSKRVLQSDWKKEGIPFYRAREIVKLSDFGFVNNDLFISESHYNELKANYGIPKLGDLMVTGVGTIGKVYIVKEDDKFYYKDASVLCFANDYHAINSDFAKILLESSFLQKQIHGQTYGNTVDTITISTANNYLFLLPPLKEQNSIVEIIKEYTTYLKTVNKNKEDLLTSIDSLKSKILDLAIRGKLVPQDPNDEPADVLLDRIKKEKEELIKECKIKRDKKESIIFKGDDNSYYEVIGTEKQNISDKITFSIPENWSISRLENICKLCDGVKIDNEKLPYLDAKTLRKIKRPELRTAGEVILPGTKLILVDGENSGEVFITDVKGYLGSTFKIIDINININQDFINLILSFYKNIFKENKTGSAVPHLNKKLFNDLIIGIPPLKEQERIVMLVNNTFKVLNLIQNSI